MAMIGATLKRIVIIFRGIGLFLFHSLTVSASPQFQNSNTLSFDWSALEPSSNLNWHECYSSSSTSDSFQHILQPKGTSKPRSFSCARLSLPLDYHNVTNPYNVTVPLLKVSSPPTSSHRGTIFTAIGGAGHSRIQDLVSIAINSDFLDGIDMDLEYDFLTFDNRGFGYSDPRAICFQTRLDGDLWEGRIADLSGVISSKTGNTGLQARFAAAKAKGELCGNQSEQYFDITQHMTTAYAARDMLEILKRLSHHSKQSKYTEPTKLKFLGLSYGTMVGQTFATMYPEHVSRIVLDGSVDGKDWTGKWQIQHLIDTDAVWASFYVDCFEAKEACPLWRLSDPNSVAIEDRIDEMLESLRKRPMYSVSDGKARLITYRDVKIAIYWTTMAPALAAPAMATILDGLIRGHTNITLEFPFEAFPTTSDCPDKETQNKRASSNSDAGLAVNCGDAEDITNNTIEDFAEYLSKLENQSSVAAFFQGERKVRCTGWSKRPKWRFTGPFTSKAKDGSSKLSTPILFIGNKLDPMTSLHTARRLVNEYPGSIVLEQNSRGHTALGSVVSTPCILRHVRAYFRDGVLPESGTVCENECNLFDGSCFMERNRTQLGYSQGRFS